MEAKTQLIKATVKLEFVESEVAREKDEASKARQQAQNSEEQLRTLQKTLSEIEDKHKQELNLTKSQLTDASEAKASLTAQLAELQQCNATLQSQLDSLRCEH